MKFSKILTISVIIIGIIISISFFTFESDSITNTEKNLDKNGEIHELSGSLFKILVDSNDLVVINGKTIPTKATFVLKENMTETYEQIGFFNKEMRPLFIIPTFTASAYSERGFYDFYNTKCNESCLTTEIISEDRLDSTSSANSVKILQLLKYDSITDLELHKNPSILENYEKIILLHNEYVSKTMFDAITAHQNVIHLYPNSLYAQVEVDSDNNKITLIRGHGYPDSEIINGFDWENENTHPYEYDNKCQDWKFYPISNGYMLNCYPENIIWKNELMLKALKDL